MYQEVRGELRLAYLAVLALTQNLVHIDDKIVHLTDLWRIASACVSIIRLAPRIRFFPLGLRPLGFVCIFDIGRTLGQTGFHAWNGVVIVTLVISSLRFYHYETQYFDSIFYWEDLSIIKLIN